MGINDALFELKSTILVDKELGTKNLKSIFQNKIFNLIDTSIIDIILSIKSIITVKYIQKQVNGKIISEYHFIFKDSLIYDIHNDDRENNVKLLNTINEYWLKNNKTIQRKIIFEDGIKQGYIFIFRV